MERHLSANHRRTIVHRGVAMIRVSLLFVLVAALCAWAPSSSLAADPEPLCSLDGESDAATATPAAKGGEALEGRLGGSRESFEDRFGEPADEVILIVYELDGCGDVYVGFAEDVLTDVSIYSPGIVDGKAEWTIDEALRIAERVLPRDAETEDPFRNESFAEHRACFSEALADEVPEAVYADLDDDPTPGQCSVVLHLDDNDGVLAIVVQLLTTDQY